MTIIIKIFGFLFAALMIYGGFKLLSQGQYQTHKNNLPDENRRKIDQNNEILNSNDKTNS
jgi:hypothetical protein